MTVRPRVMHRVALATACLAMCVSLVAQQPRDAQVPRPSQPGTATIAGRVLAAADGQPMRRVQIRLNAETSTVGWRLAVTDDNGRFAFRNVPAGRYVLGARKSAYLSMFYGMKRPARPGGASPGTVIVLADGQQMTVEFKLTRGSVITGTVRGASGQPASNVRVSAAAYARSGNGEDRTLVAVGEGSGLTDDLGAYRIYGLPPGEYVVAVTNIALTTGEFSVLTDADLRRADELLRASATAGGGVAPAPRRPTTVGFVPVYHPGTTVVANAALVALAPGEERSGVDVQLQYVSTARVAGTIAMPDGRPAAASSVWLIPTTTSGVPGLAGNSASFSTDAEGRFAFAGIVPGSYAVVVRSTAPGQAATAQSLGAQTDINVNGEDQIVNVTLQQGSTLTGSLAFDGAQPPPQDLSRVSVTLSPDRSNSVSLGAPAATIDAAGRFTITGVTPGKYRFAVAPAGLPGWSIKSGRAGGADGVDYAFDVRAREDIRDALVTMTDRVTELSGRLIDGTGAPVTDFTVIIFSADPSLWPLGQARRIQAMRPSQDGQFTFRNLGPGPYFIGAADDVERGDWLDPAFLTKLAASGAVKVTIADGEKKVQDIRVR